MVGRIVVPAVVTTARLRLREFADRDTAFVIALLNDPAFIANIGDRGVRTPEDALEYIAKGPRASYARHGFGLYLVELIDGAVPIGICGLLQRDELPSPDIGFAFLPAYRSQGFAFESAQAMMAFAADRRIVRLLAIVNPRNAPSIRLLERLGFRFERTHRAPERDVELRLFAAELPAAGGASPVC